jgi:hypothetical protein
MRHDENEPVFLYPLGGISDFILKRANRLGANYLPLEDFNALGPASRVMLCTESYRRIWYRDYDDAPDDGFHEKILETVRRLSVESAKRRKPFRVSVVDDTFAMAAPVHAFLRGFRSVEFLSADNEHVLGKEYYRYCSKINGLNMSSRIPVICVLSAGRGPGFDTLLSLHGALSRDGYRPKIISSSIEPKFIDKGSVYIVPQNQNSFDSGMVRYFTIRAAERSSVAVVWLNIESDAGPEDTFDAVYKLMNLEFLTGADPDCYVPVYGPDSEKNQELDLLIRCFGRQEVLFGAAEQGLGTAGSAAEKILSPLDGEAMAEIVIRKLGV